jgi:hypothetical protein
MGFDLTTNGTDILTIIPIDPPPPAPLPPPSPPPPPTSLSQGLKEKNKKYFILLPKFPEICPVFMILGIVFLFKDLF